MKYTQPVLSAESFHCPLCGVLAHQQWSTSIMCQYRAVVHNQQTTQSFTLENTAVAKCAHCKKSSIWINNKMVYPITGNVEMPNDDLPEDIKQDYDEARNIVNISPRGAVALLRLCVQKLCITLGERGENINNDIKNLVKKGLPATMQQALDSVRVIGNNAVHPGTIDFKDNISIAYALFGFVNVICEVLISQPKKAKEFYETHIPESARNAIDARDAKANIS